MSDNELFPGFFARGLALHVQADAALVINDLHLGIEEMHNRDGTMLPRFNFREIKDHLAHVFAELRTPEAPLKSIVINGDLKHEFGRISEQEWSEVLDMLTFLQSHCEKIVLVKGNHDTTLGPIAKWKGITIEEEGFFLPASETFATHGHKLFEDNNAYRKAKTVVIGNEHPAVSVREGVKAETFKCFLAGHFDGRQLIVVPSLNRVTSGTNILQSKLLSPYLHQPLQDFRVWAVEDKPYFLGRIGDLG